VTRHAAQALGLQATHGRIAVRQSRQFCVVAFGRYGRAGLLAGPAPGLQRGAPGALGGRWHGLAPNAPLARSSTLVTSPAMTFQTTEPPFRFCQGSRPLLISMPHVGTHVPPALAARLTEEGQRVPDTDWHLERLYDFADALGASVLGGHAFALRDRPEPPARRREPVPRAKRHRPVPGGPV
jgi:hypothetical protein